RSAEGVSHRIKGPTDVTSAVLFMVATSISEGCDLLLEDVRVGSMCEGAIDILRLMGGDVVLQNVRELADERL
ncbi:prephenate dehydrogenase/3-phosphoshikimate 1-carboxyvinyltransferase family protein, partial [Pseudomonas syringae pv. actinidiae ICMP 19096]